MKNKNAPLDKQERKYEFVRKTVILIIVVILISINIICWSLVIYNFVKIFWKAILFMIVLIGSILFSIEKEK